MIKLLLVDDHAIVRAGYRSLLAKQPNLEVLGEAGDSNSAYHLFKELQADVLITDISLPGSSGLDLISRIKLSFSQARILVFSMHQNPAFAALAIRGGALGYVSKSSEPEVLIRAIHEVYARRPILSPDIAQMLALEKLGTERIALETLTNREFEILRLLMNGHSHEEIAETLFISAKTVSNCHYLIKAKLAVNSDIELTRLAIKLNVIDLLDLTPTTHPIGI